MKLIYSNEIIESYSESIIRGEGVINVLLKKMSL
jgi:hypothetical protein